jgi:hypothetical protein
MLYNIYFYLDPRSKDVRILTPFKIGWGDLPSSLIFKGLYF